MSWCRGAGRCHGHLSTLRASASRRARGERRPVRHTSKGHNQMTHHWLPSRKHPKNDGTSSFSMGKFTISMAIFNSYLDITRGYHWFDWWSCGAAFEVDGLRARQCPRYIPIAPWQGSLPEGELGDRTGVFVFFLTSLFRERFERSWSILVYWSSHFCRVSTKACSGCIIHQERRQKGCCPDSWLLADP